MGLDPQQRTVVEAPLAARLLVEAGPGCGKTHVACERVAHLLNQGEDPDRILLLSFTRTAVHELRNRIVAASSVNPDVARQVQVRTLDSFAWRLVTDVTELGSHGASIRNALISVERAFRGEDPELEKWIKRFRHVLIDEAQDLVDDRASLIVAVLNGLPADAGWTVFMDRAQAIYGWSSEAEDGAAGERFLELISTLKGDVQEISLTTVHRTANPDLLDLLRRAREEALESPSGRRLDGVREVLGADAGDVLHRGMDLPARLTNEGTGDTLVLFRRRVDALLALSYIREAGLNCRLRIGGMPRLVASWIAVVANELATRGATLGSVTESAFHDAWQASCHGRHHSAGITPEGAWRLLQQIAMTKRQIDLRQVARRLEKRIVPDAVFNREIGASGAIIGTVHGSKGREARRVLVYMPDEVRQNPSDVELDEEARVLYVAASRAMQNLEILPTSSALCRYHEKRAWHTTSSGLQIEVGREGDVDAVTPLIHTDASAIQQRLSGFDGRICSVTMTVPREGPEIGMLAIDDGTIIGSLSSICSKSLWSITTSCAKKKISPPRWLGYLTWLDTTTVALSPEDPDAERLPHPWRETRLVLAPVVAGMGYMKRYWSKK